MAIHEEASLDGQTIKIEQQDSLIYMKLGFIGPATLEKVGGLPCETLSLFRGHFIVGNFDTIREELHKFIDQACDAHEITRKQNG
jgi:hypothetical protein